MHVHAMTRDGVLRESGLSLFQKVLLVTDGSVTELLCLYTGSEVRAHKLSQDVRAGSPPAVLGCDDDAALLHRQIVLVDGARRLLFAESVFILERLSARARAHLLETDTPIGVLWRDEKSEMYREIVDLRIEHDAAVAAHFDRPPDTLLVSRTYLLRQGGGVIGMITEKYPVEHFRD